MRIVKSVQSTSRMNIEAMEARQLLSATVTTLAAPSAAVLGQDITITAAVDSGGAAVSGGTVALLNNGVETGQTAAVNANGLATFTFGAGNALYAGSYALSAQFLGTVDANSSTSASTGLTISLPSFNTQSDGLGIATVTTGSGPGAATGDTLTVQYTGFYQSGAEFDESSAHTPGTFSYTLNATPEQVITGFDEGTTGITQGETRVLDIPSELGYMDGQERIFVIQDVGAGLTTAGPAAQLSIVGAPTTGAVGQSLGSPITVDVVDAGNNLVTGDSSEVTLSVANGPVGGVVGGTTAVQAQGGEATFDDLTFSEAGTYTLTANDGSLLPASTATITVAGSSSSLMPTLGKVSVPAAAVVGGKVAAKVQVVVSNEGDALKGSVTVNLFADSGTTLDGNQVLLGSLTRKLPIKAGKTAAFAVNVKSLPATLVAGTYYLIAQVLDPSGATSEVATTQTLSVAAPFVQPLVTIGSVAPATISLNKSGSVLVTVVNDGNVSASGIDITLNPSTDGVTPTALTLAHLTSGAKLLPGKQKSFRLHFKANSTLPPSNYQAYVLVSLDGVTATAVSVAAFTIQ